MNLNLSQNPVNEYLGPGLGGLWTGEQRAMDVATNQQSQMKTLEDIAGMQQKRQFEAQMQPHNLDKARLGNLETQQKLDKSSYDQFLSEMSQLAPGLQSVEQIETIRKKHNIPSEHPAFQTAVEFFKQGKLNDYMDKVASADPKSRDTRSAEAAKAALQEEADKRKALRDAANKKADYDRSLAVEAERTRRALATANITAKAALEKAKMAASSPSKMNWQQAEVYASMAIAETNKVLSDPSATQEDRMKAMDSRNQAEQLLQGIKKIRDADAQREMQVRQAGVPNVPGLPPPRPFQAPSLDTPNPGNTPSPQPQQTPYGAPPPGAVRPR